MFVRKATVTEDGKKQVYLEILDEKPTSRKKAHPIARLGPVNLLPGKLDDVVRGLTEFCEETFVSPEEISPECIRSWGPVLVARHLWNEVGLDEIISVACGADSCDAAFALITNRLIDPYFEYGMDSWLRGNFVPDRAGEGLDAARLRKKLRSSGTSAASFWDNILRRLASKRRVIAEGLLETIRGIGGPFDEVALYELDTDFIERTALPRDLARLPSQSRMRSVRLFLGAVTCGDWPLVFRFLGGGEPTAVQIKRLIEESRRRLGFRRVLVVLPSGTDEEKLHQLRSFGFDYLVGVRRRRDPRAVELIHQAGRQWMEIDSDTKVQEVLLPAETDASLYGLPSEDLPTERYFIIHSRGLEKEERALRVAVVKRALRALQDLKRGVDTGRFKKPVTIMARAERILSHNKGYRHISCRMTPEGQFQFWEDKRKSAVQKSYEGISLLKTSDPKLSPSSAVFIYEGLRRLESAFDEIHDIAASRSTPLPLPDLVVSPGEGALGDLFEGHLLVSQVAFFLRCRLERRLLEKKMALSLEDAIEALRTISLAELRIGRARHVIVSPGDRVAGRIVRALGIKDLQPTTSMVAGSARAPRK